MYIGDPVGDILWTCVGEGYARESVEAETEAGLGMSAGLAGGMVCKW